MDETEPPANWSDVTIVAHRAGNDLATARAAARAGWVVEVDVHVFRRRLEVRHEKVLWPFSRLWEKWFLLPKGAPRLELAELLDAVGPGTRVLLDLKCFSRRSARRVRAAVPTSAAVIVSSRTWWTLGAFVDRRDTPALRSCGNRMQLWLAVRWPGLGDRVGVTAHARLLTPQVVSQIRQRTPHVYSWALPSEARTHSLVRAGLTGAVLDDPTVVDT